MIRGREDMRLGDLCAVAELEISRIIGSLLDDELQAAAAKHSPAREVARFELARREELER